MAKTVTDYLDDAAQCCPEKVAFKDENRTITYAELRYESLQLASVLIEKGLFKQPLAVFLDKSIECIVAFFGIAYSGNFYTLLDTEMPNARIEKIIETLHPDFIISDDRINDFELGNNTRVINIKSISKVKIDEPDIYRVKSRILESDVQYVLFTSGSTGTPKGVVTPHRAVTNYIEALTDAYDFNDTSVVGNQVPFYFVMSIVDIYGTVYKHGTMYIIPKKNFMFPGMLARYIADNKINTLSWVPSALCIISNRNAFKSADLTCLRTIIFGGEVMPIKQLKEWQKNVPDAVYINGYGPTEVTDGCTYYKVDRNFDDNATLPIGIPFSNSEILVIDENNELVRDGIGELCVRSDSMTYGYYNDFDKTNEVFVQNPLNSAYKEIVYKTGDLVRYNHYGELEYVGRKDFQIKHMGRRIELGEIEANVATIGEIRENCCLYDTDQQMIVLFYEGDIEEDCVSNKLADLLPDYMVPKRIRRLTQMPHNVNGKIDRSRLKSIMTGDM